MLGSTKGEQKSCDEQMEKKTIKSNHHYLLNKYPGTN